MSKERVQIGEKLQTQFTRAQGLELLDQLKERRLDYEQLETEAKTSKKKARRLRQVQALLAIYDRQGLEFLEKMLKNPEYDTYAIDEEGHILAKRTRQDFLRWRTGKRF